MIKLIAIGKTKETYFNEAIAVYIKRLSFYIKFEFLILPDIKNAANMSHDILKAKEAELFLRNIKNDDTVILLDDKGKNFSSLEWSKHLEQKISSDSKDIVFIIGGAFGFDDSLYQRANEKLSLSKFTFSHQMVRLIFVEQLYRAFTIIKGEKYHHE